jgi:hypothetical protein
LAVVAAAVMPAASAAAGEPLTIRDAEFQDECGGAGGATCVLYRVTVQGTACGADATAEVFADITAQPAVAGTGGSSTARLGAGPARPILAVESEGAQQVFFQARCRADATVVSNVLAVDLTTIAVDGQDGSSGLPTLAVAAAAFGALVIAAYLMLRPPRHRPATPAHRRLTPSR